MTESHLKAHPGEYLATLRAEKGYSQEYVAGKLHLRSRVIDLLETGAYHELPQPVFVQGYLRAYAKLLEVDPAPLLHQYDVLKGPEGKVQILRQQNRPPRFREMNLPWLVGGGVLVLLALGYTFWHHHTPVKESASKPTTIAHKVVLDDPVLAHLTAMESRRILEQVSSPLELNDEE